MPSTASSPAGLEPSDDLATTTGEPQSPLGLPSVQRLIGWFQIGWSAEFPVGEVVPLRYFCTDLAAYRAEDGELIVLDAHCQHMGAHLGYGGTVDGNCVVCPFHGWKWDSEGVNVDIPYSTKVNRAKRMRRWPVGEREGLAYLWHDPDGSAPRWDMPLVCRPDTEYFSVFPDACNRWDEVRVHPQITVENAADAAHFKYVHLAPEAASVRRFEPNGPVLEVVFELKMGRQDRDTWLTEQVVTATLDSRAWGVGMMSTRFGGTDDAINLVATTPIDEHHSAMMSTVWVPKPEGSEEGLPKQAMARIAEQFKQIERDVVIWEHLAYIDRPPFAIEESREFMALRRWSRQFYADPSSKIADPEHE